MVTSNQEEAVISPLWCDVRVSRQGGGRGGAGVDNVGRSKERAIFSQNEERKEALLVKMMTILLNSRIFPRGGGRLRLGGGGEG